MQDEEYRIEESNGIRQIMRGNSALSIDQILQELNSSHDMRRVVTRAFNGLRELMEDYGR